MLTIDLLIQLFLEIKLALLVSLNLALTLVFALLSSNVIPCTGITLKSKDGGVVVARTVEWALNDAQHNQILVVPRNKKFVG